MSKITIFFILVPVIGAILLLANVLLSVHKPDMEKLSPFECGFQSFGQTRSPFSISFYIVGLLFLIFDLEVSLLFPYIVSTEINGTLGLSIIIMFIIILTIGFVYEYSKNVFKFTDQNK